MRSRCNHSITVLNRRLICVLCLMCFLSSCSKQPLQHKPALQIIEADSETLKRILEQQQQIQWQDVAKLIATIEPWRNSTAYAEADWLKLARIARVGQLSDSLVFERALRSFVDEQTNKFNGAFEEDSKPYLLLRVMFLLPTNAPRSQRFSYKGWVRFDEDRNPDGSVNLSWPIEWHDGQPRLVSGCVGSDGMRYDVVGELRHMREHYGYRELGRMLKLENL